MAQNQRTYQEIKQDIFLLRNHRVFGHFNVPVDECDLTDEEQRARRQWNEERAALVRDIDGLDELRLLPRENSLQLLMESVTLPPFFAHTRAAKRSTRSENRSQRYYPPHLHEWDTFIDLVNDFTIPVNWERGSIDVARYQKNHLMHSITAADSKKCSNESDELCFLRRIVWNKLEQFGCFTPEDEVRNGTDVVQVGRPDHFSVATDSNNAISVIIEMRSLQNLRLPSDFDAIKARYEEGFREQTTTTSKNLYGPWSQIGHPLAQTLAYMVDNNCRYGALCSASKTYFIHIEGKNCKVTRAWFTCEEHYLKAWLAFLKAAEEDVRGGNREDIHIDLSTPKNWREKTPEMDTQECETINPVIEHDTSRPDEDGPESDGRSGTRDSKRPRRSPRNHPGSKKYAHSFKHVPPSLYRYETPSPNEMDLNDFERKLLHQDNNSQLKFVPLSELNFESVLGEGRNGAVRKTTWNGREVAVKQFDLNKDFDYYKREVEAYTHLRGAWGTHVPTPLFISRTKTWSVAYLGMTMGRKIPDCEKEKYMDKLVDQVNSLKRNFNFCHMDLWYQPRGRTDNFIVDKNDNVLLIDLEDWELKNEE